MLLEPLDRLGPRLPETYTFEFQRYVGVWGGWPLALLRGPHDYLYARWLFAHADTTASWLYVAQRPDSLVVSSEHARGFQVDRAAMRRELLRTSVLPYVYLGTTSAAWSPQPTVTLWIVPLAHLEACHVT